MPYDHRRTACYTPLSRCPAAPPQQKALSATLLQRHPQDRFAKSQKTSALFHQRFCSYRWLSQCPSPICSHWATSSADHTLSHPQRNRRRTSPRKTQCETRRKSNSGKTQCRPSGDSPMDSCNENRLPLPPNCKDLPKGHMAYPAAKPHVGQPDISSITPHRPWRPLLQSY